MTSRRLFLAGLFAALVLAVLTGGEFPYFVLAAMAVVFLSSYLMVWWNAKRLYMSFHISNEVLTAGEPLNIEYKLTNMSVVPAAYILMNFVVSRRLGDMEFAPETAYFGPFQMISIKKTVICRNRGYFSIGKIVAQIQDPLGLFSRRVVFDKAIDLTVYPRVYPLEGFDLPAREFYGRTAVSMITHEDFTSLKGIRAYRRGDNIKKIHWKLTSKMDYPFIKEFDLSADTKVHVLVDGYGMSIDPENLDLQDGLVEITVSLIHHLLKRHVAVSMVCNTKNRLSIEGQDFGRFGVFLEELTGYVPSGEQAFDDFLRAETGKLYYGSTLVAITHRLDEGLLYTLLGIREKGFDIILIMFGSDVTEDFEAVSLLSARGILTYSIRERSDILKILEVGYGSKAQQG